MSPESVAWITTPAVGTLLKQRYRVASTDSPIWSGPLTNGSIDGEPAIGTTQAPRGTMVYGDWSQVIVAEFGVLLLEVDPFTDSRSGKLGLRAMYSVDVGVRHGGSFTVATSIS